MYVKETTKKLLQSGEKAEILGVMKISGRKDFRAKDLFTPHYIKIGLLDV